MPPPPAYGESEARKVIAIYGAEVVALAKAAIAQYPDYDPPGGVICEPGTAMAESLAQQVDPRVPIRVVEGGVTLAALPREKLRELVDAGFSECSMYLDLEAFTGPGRLPVLAICKEGHLLGGTELGCRGAETAATTC